jgi:hypothetical protein
LILIAKNIQPLIDTETMKGKAEELVSSLPVRRREPPCKDGSPSSLALVKGTYMSQVSLAKANF